jgi:hypothetical protein
VKKISLLLIFGLAFMVVQVTNAGAQAPGYAPGPTPYSGNQAGGAPGYAPGPTPYSGNQAGGAPSYSPGPTPYSGNQAGGAPGYAPGPTPYSGNQAGGAPGYAPGTAPHLPLMDDPSASGSSYHLNQPVNQGGVNGVIGGAPGSAAAGGPCADFAPGTPPRQSCEAQHGGPAAQDMGGNMINDGGHGANSAKESRAARIKECVAQAVTAFTKETCKGLQ